MSSDDSLPAMLQACAIPYRVTAKQIEVCLVTTIKRRRWVFPKGIIDPGETPQQAALKEAWEEAGLRGRIVGDEIGRYERRKWGRRIVIGCYLMQVSRQSDKFHESEVRERLWLSPAEAAKMLAHDGQRESLIAALKHLRKRKPQAG